MRGQYLRRRVLVGSVQRPFLTAVGAAAVHWGRWLLVDAPVFGSWRFGVRVALGLLVLAIAAALLTWILLWDQPDPFTARRLATRAKDPRADAKAPLHRRVEGFAFPSLRVGPAQCFGLLRVAVNLPRVNVPPFSEP